MTTTSKLNKNIQVGDVMIAKHDIPFSDGTKHCKSQIKIVSPLTLAYYQLNSDMYTHIPREEVEYDDH